MKLRISPELTLPQDTVTSTLVVYGGKGMGKTNLGSVLVEELDKCHLKWAALDPLGVWYGVRHSQDGKGPGIECVVLGGVHGDMPIEPTGGAVVADLVVDEPGNVVIDFSRKPSGEMWTIGEKIRFVTEYTKRVFQRQGSLLEGRRREPFMQVLDEAARYVPQVIPHGNPQLAECLGAWETLVEEGRNVGIGVLLLTQRSARMAKSVSEVADAMFSFRIIGPNSVAAVMDWMGEHVPKERIKNHIEVLRSLERGQCLIVSPGWLRFEGVVTIRARETFDSSATPKPGERPARVTGKAAKPDLAKYVERMKETIQRAEANDPKKLHAKIRELQGELAKKLPIGNEKLTKQTVKVSKAEIRSVLRVELEPLRKYALDLRQRLTAATQLVNRFGSMSMDFADRAGAYLREHGPVPDYPALHIDVKAVKEQAVRHEQQNLAITPADRTHTGPHPPHHGPTVGTAGVERPEGSTWNGDLPEGEKTVLKAIARYTEGVERNQLTVLTGYRRSTRDQYISRLKPKGLIDERGGRILATQAGIVALGRDYNPQPATGHELQEYWMSELPDGEKRILKLLIAANGKAVDRDTLDEPTGFSRSTRDQYLSRLGSKRLVEPDGRGQIRAAASLFVP